MAQDTSFDVVMNQIAKTFLEGSTCSGMLRYDLDYSEGYYEILIIQLLIYPCSDKLWKFCIL